MEQVVSAPLSCALCLEDIHVAYGEVSAVRDVRLEVKRGELFGLIGLNGAGKTTIIKTVLGLRKQDHGIVSVLGQPSGQQEIKRDIAFLPERFDPPWFLSGFEFLKFSASLYGRTLAFDVCAEYANRISLDPEALRRRVQTYSKGMRQKLGVLGTILTGCDFLLLDEPMSGLDPVARAQVKKVLLDEKAKGASIFFSSHVLADMDEICDRVAVLYDKTIQFVGTPEDFRAQASSQTLEQAFLHFIEDDAAT